MHNIIKLIDVIQENIFRYNINNISKSISLLVDYLVPYINVFINEENKLNEILNLINTSLLNRDYLLLADILEYEFRPLVDKYGGENEYL